MKFILVTLALVGVVAAQYNYPAPPPPPAQEYIPPAASSHQIAAAPPPAPAPEYIPPPPPAPAPEYIPPAPPSNEYIPPGHDQGADGYRYRTVKRLRYRNRF